MSEEGIEALVAAVKNLRIDKSRFETRSLIQLATIALCNMVLDEQTDLTRMGLFNI